MPDGRVLSHLPRFTSLTEGSDDSVPEAPFRLAHQGSRRFRCYATMPKASRVLAALTLPLGIPSYVRQLWYRHRKRVAGPRKPELLGCCLLASRHRLAWHRPLRGGRGVGARRFLPNSPVSSHALPATFIGGGCLHARSPPCLHRTPRPRGPSTKRPRPLRPWTNNLIAILHAIGAGAAADGQPWPERHHLRSRQMQLSDADCALTGQRIVQEILLATERAPER